MKGKSDDNYISKLRFKTFNCGGINGTTPKANQKRQKMFNSCRLTTDISILTETKWLPANLPRFKNEWESELHAACTDRLHAQAGVAILIRRGLAIDIVDKGTDPQGRVAWILADIYSKKLLIIGV